MNIEKIKTVTKLYETGSNNFCGYHVTINNSNKEYSIPNDDGNRHYQAIQEWAKIEGNNIIDPGA